MYVSRRRRQKSTIITEKSTTKKYTEMWTLHFVYGDAFDALFLCTPNNILPALHMYVRKYKSKIHIRTY